MGWSVCMSGCVSQFSFVLFQVHGESNKIGPRTSLLSKGFDAAITTCKQSPSKTILEMLNSQKINIAFLRTIASATICSKIGLWLLQKDKNTSPALSWKPPKPEEVVLATASQLVFSCGPCGASQQHTPFLFWLTRLELRLCVADWKRCCWEAEWNNNLGLVNLFSKINALCRSHRFLRIMAQNSLLFFGSISTILAQSSFTFR